MNDHPTTQPAQPALADSDRRRAELADDLAAIVARAGRIGIAAWRVETALGISARRAHGAD